MSDQKRKLSRRAFLAATTGVSSLYLLPRTALAQDEATLSDGAAIEEEDVYRNGLTETFLHGGEEVTVTYSYSNGIRSIEIEHRGESHSIWYDTASGELHSDGALVGSRRAGGTGRNVTLASDGWTEIDRGWQNLTWVVGTSMIVLGAMISAAIGVSVADIILSSADALQILVESKTSMDLYCIWEHYFTVIFQQTRVTCYYYADDLSFGPFLWYFNNA